MCQTGKNYPVVFPIGTDVPTQVGKNYRVRDVEKIGSGIENQKKRQNGRGSNAKARDLILVPPTVKRIVAWTVVFLLSVVLNPSGSQSGQPMTFD